jgi:PAS domain S-box-containing protein
VNSSAQINELFTPYKAATYELEAVAESLVDEAVAKRNARVAELERNARILLTMQVIVSIGALIAIFSMLYSHARYVAFGLAKFEERIVALASPTKLLDQELVWPQDDEFRSIATQMNKLLATLRSLYAQIVESEESLAVTVRSIGDGLIAVDVHARVTRLNPVAEALTGMSEKQALGRPVEEVMVLVDAATKEVLPVPLRAVAERGVELPLPAEVLLRSQTGNERRIDDSMRPLFSLEGALLGAVMVFRDVTDQEALAARLRHAEKMDAVGKLAGGIAHDFNNMLTGILGSAEFLHHQALGEEAKECLEIIERSAERAALMNAKLLAFSRRGTKLSTPVHLHRVIEDVVLLMRHSLDKSVEIQTVYGATLDRVIGDPSQIQNALMNLAINARDAIAQTGVLVYRTRNVEISGNEPGYEPFALEQGIYCIVEVEDSGAGIDEEVLPHIFDPFYTTKDVGKGTGLGLASVYGTMTEHHGAVSVRSRPGQTVFELAFPTAEGVEVLPVPSRGKALTSGSGCVLVVDDEEMLHRIARSILMRCGFEVIVAENGEDALNELQKHPEVCAVVLDMIMPTMGGVACLKKIRERQPTLPVILVSGFSNSERIQEHLKVGYTFFLSKPYRSADLIQCIHDCIFCAPGNEGL